jgi:hypothetical protein
MSRVTLRQRRRLPGRGDHVHRLRRRPLSRRAASVRSGSTTCRGFRDRSQLSARLHACRHCCRAVWGCFTRSPPGLALRDYHQRTGVDRADCSSWRRAIAVHHWPGPSTNAPSRVRHSLTPRPGRCRRAAAPSGRAGTELRRPACRAMPEPSACPCSTCRVGRTARGCRMPSPSSAR